MRSIRTKFKDGDNTVEIVVMDHSKNEEVMIHVELPITWKDPVVVSRMHKITKLGEVSLDDDFFSNEEMLCIAKAYELAMRYFRKHSEDQVSEDNEEKEEDEAK